MTTLEQIVCAYEAASCCPAVSYRAHLQGMKDHPTAEEAFHDDIERNEQHLHDCSREARVRLYNLRHKLT